MSDRTMAQVSGLEPSSPNPVQSRWAALRLTSRFRRHFIQACVVAVASVALIGGLAFVFGILILQYAMSGLIVSSIVIVAAIGLTVLYGIRGFANFAYGDLMTLGAYLALLLSLNGQFLSFLSHPAVDGVFILAGVVALALDLLRRTLLLTIVAIVMFGLGLLGAVIGALFGGAPLIWGAIVSFLILALVGVLLEVIIFARLEGRGPVPPIVASVGVGLIIQNGIRAVAGTQEWLYPVPATQDIVIVTGLGIHPVRGILTLLVGLAFVFSAHILLKYTNLGKAMRATADNLELAKATGIDTKRVTYAAWVVSCSFASTAGILLGLGTAINPTMGFDVLLLIFAAVIVGGIGSPYGAMLGGLLVGFSQEMSVPFLVWLERPDVIGLQFGSAYKVAIPFIILFIVLIFRPWGIAGRRPAFARRSYLLERITRVFGDRRAMESKPGEADGGR